MKHISRLLSALLSLSLLFGTLLMPRISHGASHPFVDLPGGHYDATIITLWEYGIVSGLEADKYVPDGPVTRAQMAALIIRAMGKSSEAELAKSVASEFTDVPTSHWASGVITLASRAGIIKGDGGRFFPNDPVNYAQAATMLVRALGYEDQVTGGYPSGYVLKANELGLLSNLRFELYTGVNRAEAAVLLYNSIFRSPSARDGLTWSQSIHRRPKTLSMGALPTYVAPGERIPLTAVVADAEGKPIPNAPVQFRVISGNGQLEGNTLVVSDGGPITVQASTDHLTASGSVTPVSSLVITPDTFQVNKGSTVQLSATALSGGARVIVQPQWRVTQGPATVTEQGLLSIRDYGAVTVQATLGDLTAVANGQAVGKVTILSKPAFVVPGLSYNLTASTTDSAGKPITVPITWTAVGATIDRNTGRLTNPVGSQVTVRATAAGLTEEAVIPVIKSVTVYPNNTTVLIGRTVNFTASGLDSSGKQYDLQPKWERANATIGVIDADGEFAGVNSGVTDIVAEIGSLRGRATVRVSGPPNRLGISVGSTALPSGTGATTEVTVRLLDNAGNLSPVSDQPISLTLTDSGRGSLSRTLVLSQEGEAKVTYTTGDAAGTATISASAPGTTMAAQAAVITTYTPVPTYVQLSASPQPLATGGGVAVVTAMLKDSNNLPAPAPQNLYVSLTSSGAMAGSLTGNTITILAGQTSGSISFISGGVPGTVQINGTSSYPVRGVTLQTSTAGSPAKTRIRPISGDTPVTGLSTLQVEVEVLDASGVMRANDNSTQVELSVSMSGAPQGTVPQVLTATASGGVATFQVPAYMVGTASLTSSLVGQAATSADEAEAKFVPGVYSSLKLTAMPSSIPADGYSQTQIIAEVTDRSGMVLTSINPTVTFRKLVDNGVTAALTDVKVQAVAGRAVLTVQAGRLAGTDTWYASAPGLETQNLATVTTTATSGEAHTLRVTGNTSFTIGSTGTLVVQVVDQLGRVVTTDSGRTIAITHSLPGVSVAPSTAVTQNGVATFVISGSQATSGTLTISSSGMTIPVVQSTISFGTGSTSAYSLFASSSAATARVGTAVTVWVRVMDAQGRNLTTDSGRTVTASINGSATVTPTTAATSGGLATFTVTGAGVGNVILTFSANGLTQSSTTLVITFTN